MDYRHPAIRTLTIALGDEILGRRVVALQAGRRVVVMLWLLRHPTVSRLTSRELGAKLGISNARVIQISGNLRKQFNLRR